MSDPIKDGGKWWESPTIDITITSDHASMTHGHETLITRHTGADAMRIIWDARVAIGEDEWKIMMVRMSESFGSTEKSE